MPVMGLLLQPSPDRQRGEGQGWSMSRVKVCYSIRPRRELETCNSKDFLTEIQDSG